MDIFSSGSNSFGDVGIMGTKKVQFFESVEHLQILLMYNIVPQQVETEQHAKTV